MRRFWQHAAATATDAGHVITLDGKPMRLPGGPVLVVPGAALADCIAAEWQAAPEEFGPDHLRLTGLAGTVPRIAADPHPTIDALARYGESDLLCYRAATPEALVRRQQTLWQPWLDWAANALDAKLRVARGVMFVPQDRQALAALRQAVAACPAGVLAALGMVVPATGSLVLGLAMVAGVLEAAAAQALADLDERFQNEVWGEDAAALARRDRIAADLAAAERFLALVRAT
jgi:chaperone required for assembly of F1-ATPase